MLECLLRTCKLPILYLDYMYLNSYFCIIFKAAYYACKYIRSMGKGEEKEEREEERERERENQRLTAILT